MKILKYISFIILGAFIFGACSEEDKTIYNPDNVEKSVISSPGEGALSFTIDNADDVISFEWSETDAGINLQIDYDLQLATDEAFENNTTLVTTSDLSADVTVSTFNNALNALELNIGEESTVYCRVVAVISEYVEDVVSDSKAYQVTPYEDLIDYPRIYVPGEYQGWSPGEENGCIFSYNFDNTYEGIIRITDGSGEFKISIDTGWAENYGGTLTASGDDYSGTLESGGSNFVVTPGTYAFVVDLDAMTIQLTKTEDWGIIGGAVPPYDWSVDVDMFYNGQRKMWEITADFEASDIKFRADDDWGLNYGSDEADGTLQANGANIALEEAGNYTIRMNPDLLIYTIEKN